MKKLPFLILVAICVTGLFGGIFLSAGVGAGALADVGSEKSSAFSNEVSAAASTINSADDLHSFVFNYGAGDAEANISLGGSSVYDMSDFSLQKTIGTEQTPFCGTFDGQGRTISNLTIDLSAGDVAADTVFAGLFGKLGKSDSDKKATIKNVTFQNLKIKTGKGKTIYAGAIAFAENAQIENVKILSSTNVTGAEIDAEYENFQANAIYLGGLFGYAKNCTISGIQIGLDVNFKAAKAESAYIGGLVGKAESTKFTNIQISASASPLLNMSLLGKLVQSERESFAFNFNLNFGGMAGCMENSSALDVICRTSSFGDAWNFAQNDGKIHNLGGVVGLLENSTLYFGISKSNFNVFVEDSFKGTINLGGIVGSISQANSAIINVGTKNTFNIIDRATNQRDQDVLFVGEIVGKISNPVPQTGNISYVHFSENDGINLFGNKGSYIFKNENQSDYLTDSGNFDLDNLVSAEDSYSYFSKQDWDSLLGKWDFVNTWYVSAQRIYLQNFDTAFSVTLSNFNENILQFVGINGNRDENAKTLSNLSYGDVVEFEFAFRSAGSANMNEFYDLATLRYNGNDVARFIKVGDAYKLSGSELYDIKMVEDESKVVGFKIVIKKITRATSGSYVITVSSKKYSAVIRTRLYDGDNADVWNQQVSAPGLLQSDNGTLRDILPLTGMTYGAEYHIRTQAKSVTNDGEIYAPTQEWFIVTSRSEDEEGNVIEDITQISQEYVKDGILVFTFGEGVFRGNLEIFAKYTSTACTGIFTFDEGVQKILLSNDTILVENSGDKKPISKTENKLNMDIYILDGYEFDSDRFIEQLQYKTKDTESKFCQLESATEKDGATVYRFFLDMTNVEWADVEIKNIFSVQVKTTKIENYDLTWVWCLVGCVGGAILITGIVLLIVWLVRRKQNGGGGKMKISKKNYKNMYY